MKQNAVNTLIVEDHLLFAEGLARILLDMPEINLLKIVNSYNEVRQLLAKHPVDLMLLDIKLKNESGIDICSLVKELNPQTKIILVSMFDPNTLALDIKKCNANGYIPKSTDAQEVKETINTVLQGENVFLELGANSDGETPVDKLITTREKEIIVLINQGKTAKEISEILHISIYTVDTHRKNILKKLNLNSIKNLIAYSMSNPNL